MSAPESTPARGDDLSALFLNCTLKRSPEPSHTDTLLDVVREIMAGQGVSIDSVRVVDHRLAPGVQPDMREHGFEVDDWPELFPRVRDANILVIGTPIWLGDRSSVCTRVIERLYAQSAQTNERGQYLYYGKVGGCIVTGNEDGVKHVARDVLYALQHLGYAIPPQADAGWIGEAGPGPSYGDEGPDGRVGFDNEFTQRTATFMAWNLIHLARLLEDAGGFPTHGNSVTAWEEGERFGHPAGEER